MKGNGHRLLEFCTINDPATTNTFFALKDQHRVSWCHPKSKHWHQIDFILAGRTDVNCVRVTRNFHSHDSADRDTDHTLVSKLSVKAKPKHHSTPAPRPKVYVNMCKHYSEKETFKNEIQIKNDFQLLVSVDENW